MEKPLQRRNLNEVVRSYVKEYILDQGLSAGDPLPPEVQLAQNLGVGRGSVREAIKALQSLGIVEVRHGEGLYVREFNFDPILETLGYALRFDATTLAELTDIRVLLERAAIGEAVTRIGPDALARLETIMAAWQERVESDQPHSDLDEAFHRILYGVLQNHTLLKFLEVFWIAFENLDNPTIQTADPEQELTDHRAILAAVRAGDADLAQCLLIEHFEPLRRRINQVAGPAVRDSS